MALDDRADVAEENRHIGNVLSERMGTTRKSMDSQRQDSDVASVFDSPRNRGIGAFGHAYRVMLENDSHAAGSVDWALARAMVRLSEETATILYGTFTPIECAYSQGSRPRLEDILAKEVPANASCETVLERIAGFTSRLGDHAESDPGKMRIGGTEEQIIERGTDWCTDVARVACVLCQVAGFPCRIVNLFDLGNAYSGHVIVEAYREGRWGALDSSTAVEYRAPDGRPASVWELMNDQRLLESHQGPDAHFTTAEQFRAAGIVNYSCWDSNQYDYTMSGMNEYYLRILEMSKQGWPGGLRWIQGEDRQELES